MSRDTDPHDHHSAGDSAGVPWEGRRFEQNRHSGDDGSADPQLLAALRAFHDGTGDQVAVVQEGLPERVAIEGDLADIRMQTVEGCRSDRD